MKQKVQSAVKVSDVEAHHLTWEGISTETSLRWWLFSGISRVTWSCSSTEYPRQ